MITHLVFMKFKPDTDEKDIRAMENGLAGLPGIIPEIRSYDFGRDVLRTDRSYDFGLVSAFEDVAALKRYQVHPEHQKVVQICRRICESILAVDYESR